MVETFIAGTVLALACFWAWRYGHIIVGCYLVAAAVIGGWAILSGAIQPLSEGTTVTTVAFVVLAVIFAVM